MKVNQRKNRCSITERLIYNINNSADRRPLLNTMYIKPERNYEIAIFGKRKN